MIYIYFHSRDLDGHCSGALAAQYYLNNKPEIPFKLIGIDYGEEPDVVQFQSGDTVYFLDWTWEPHEKMIELSKKVHLIVIDHHKTSEYLMSNPEFVGSTLIDMNLSACQLCEVWFGLENKEYVKLLGLFDIWKKNEPDWDSDIVPFQYGMRGYQTDPTTEAGMITWNMLKNNVFDVSLIKSVGRAILQYQKKIYAEDMKNSFEVEFEGLKAIAYIGSHIGSQQFESVWDNNKYDLMMSIRNSKNKGWNVSLYTDKDIDLSILAKKHGGGGHKQACGLQIKDLKEIL